MFSAKLYPHSLLKTGELLVPAVITIKSDGSLVAAPGGGDSKLVFGGLVDCSGSMGGEKIAAARNGMRKVVASLPSNAFFFLVQGGGNSEETKTVFPLEQATDDAKRRADAVIGKLTARYGTAISGWLDEAERQFARMPDGIKRGLLLTDGQNQEDKGNKTCHQSAARCKGKFQLDCRGVGSDWDVPLLKHIAGELLGTVDVIKEAAETEAEFRSILKTSAAKSVSDVRVRITCPLAGTTIDYFKQMAPEMVDLTKQGTSTPNTAGPGLVFEFPTGAWGKEETRDYQVGIKVGTAGTPGGNRLLAGRVSVFMRNNGVENVLKLDSSAIAAAWTDDARASVLAIPPELTRYGKEGALVQKMQAAIEAKESGDTAGATKLLNQASILAEELGNEGTKKLIRDVAVVDERTKLVKELRKDANAADWIAAGTRSVRTKVLDSK